MLEYEADVRATHLVPFVRTERRQFAPAHRNAPPGRSQQTSDQGQQRRLAAPGWTGHDREARGRKIAADAVEHEASSWAFANGEVELPDRNHQALKTLAGSALIAGRIAITDATRHIARPTVATKNTSDSGMAIQGMNPET